MQGKTSVDFAGALLLLLTNGLFIYAIDQLPRVGWRHPAFFLTLALAAIALVFLLRAEARAKMPILVLSMFRAPAVQRRHRQLVRARRHTCRRSIFSCHFIYRVCSAIRRSQIGWIIVADSVIIMVMAPIAGALSDRLGSRLLCTLGCSVVAIAQFFLASLDLNASLVRIMLPLVLWGIGWSLFNAPNQRSILSAVSYGKNRRRRRHDRHQRAHRRRHGRGIVRDLVRLSARRRRFDRNQVNSPESWRAAPEIFMGAFSTTIYVLSFFTLLAVFSSAVRGSKPNSEPIVLALDR